MLIVPDLLQFAVAAALVMALALALIISASARVLRRQISQAPPARRVWLLAGVLAAPAVAALCYGGLILALPLVLQESTRLDSACAGHAQALWHLCVWHPGSHGQVPWLWSALAVPLLLLAGAGTRSLILVRRQRRMVETMAKLGRPYSTSVHVVESPEAIALACGLGRGRILLSNTLLNRLPLLQVRAVVAHEQAHLAQRDLALRITVSLLSRLLMPGTRRRLLSELDLALEQRCDQAAARAVGSPLVVAEAIVAVERLRNEPLRTPWAMTFDSDFVSQRVEALLVAPGDRARWLGPVLTAVFLAICVLSVGWVHHATELLIHAIS